MRFTPTSRVLGLATATLMAGLATAHANDRNTSLDAKVHTALKQCQTVSASCASTTQNAEAVLVFPSVVKADLIVGGSGGQGALVENGKITGYYNIGGATAGLTAGISDMSQVYVFRSQTAVAELKKGSKWKVGSGADVTVVNADANARAVSGDVLAYIIDSEGLHAGVSVDVFNVWKADKQDRS